MPSEPIYKVFVSSTFDDLREERAEVQKALLKLNCLPVGMELFPAADDETWDFIKDQINDSDYYVVLIAGRYGSLAPDGISFTEKEYDYARAQGIPSIGFVHANRAEIPSGKTDTDPAVVVKLEAFLKKIKTRLIRQFRTPHELALEVTTSFVDLKRTKPRIGFVRANEVVEYKRYAEILEKVSELESKLSDIKLQTDEPFPGHDESAIELPQDGSDSIVSVKWSDVFLAVVSVMNASPGEPQIARYFFFHLVRHLQDKRLTHLQGNTLSEDALSPIRDQLFALDLIDFFDEQVTQPVPAPLHSYANRVRSWKLTDYGRKQFARLRLSKR